MSRRGLLVGLVLGVVVAVPGIAQEGPCTAPPSTFELIQTRIFNRGCTQSYCHGDARVAGLDLRAGAAYDSLLPAQRSGPYTGEHYNFVEPGRPGESSLWLTLAKKTLELPDVLGAAMPIGGAPLSEDELEGIRLWIMAGAPRTGTVNGVASLIPACPSPTPTDAGQLPPPCRATDRNLLLPDLVTDPPQNVRVLYQGGRRVISFTTAVGNTGQGPLIVQPAARPTAAGQSLDAVQIIHRADGSKCTRPAGAVTYESDGKKWAYADLVLFELRKGHPFTGEVVARRNKDYYCLLDTDRIRGFTGYPRQYEAHCEDDIGRMGISVGYKDLYHRVHPGQWIDLDADPGTSIPTGAYYLVNVADPLNDLAETNGERAANSGYVRVNVNLPDIRPRTPAPLPTATPTATARRPVPTARVRLPRPTRVPRPPRPPRPTRVPRPGAPTATPAVPPPPPTPTAPTAPTAPASGGDAACRNACAYQVSQVRLTWYDQTGLALSFNVSPRSCPVIAPAAGDPFTLHMGNWRATRGEPTAHRYDAALRLATPSAAAADGRTLSLVRSGTALRVLFKASAPAIARAADGSNFPVAFDLCVTIGGHAVSASLACQPKSTGLLCHQL